MVEHEIDNNEDKNLLVIFAELYAQYQTSPVIEWFKRKYMPSAGIFHSMDYFCGISLRPHCERQKPHIQTVYEFTCAGCVCVCSLHVNLRSQLSEDTLLVDVGMTYLSVFPLFLLNKTHEHFIFFINKSPHKTQRLHSTKRN